MSLLLPFPQLGGANNFLGGAYVTVGGLSLLLSLFFAVLSTLWGRTAGDPKHLSWNRAAAGRRH